MIQQRRLPNPRLTPDYEHTAAPTTRSLTQPIQSYAFVSPTAKGQPPGSWLTDSHQNRDPKGILRNYLCSGGFERRARECPRNCVGMNERDAHAFNDKQEISRSSEFL